MYYLFEILYTSNLPQQLHFLLDNKKKTIILILKLNRYIRNPLQGKANIVELLFLPQSLLDAPLPTNSEHYWYISKIHAMQ